MVQKYDGFYFMTDKLDYVKVGGDLALWSWYSILKDYAKRFRKDRHGYTRVGSDMFADDYGIDRTTVWRYNRKLEDKGLLELDRAYRGGRTWIGFKLF